MTLINLTLGWWGIISFIINVFNIINNTVQYIGALGMDPPPADAAPPELLDDTVEKLSPYTEEIISRLNNDADLQDVAEEFAHRARCSPGEVFAYVFALMAMAEREGE